MTVPAAMIITPAARTIAATPATTKIIITAIVTTAITIIITMPAKASRTAASPGPFTATTLIPAVEFTPAAAAIIAITITATTATIITIICPARAITVAPMAGIGTAYPPRPRPITAATVTRIIRERVAAALPATGWIITPPTACARIDVADQLKTVPNGRL